MYTGLHVKYPLFLSDFKEIWNVPTDLKKKYSNIKFNEKPSRGSWAVLWGRDLIRRALSAGQMEGFLKEPTQTLNRTRHQTRRQTLNKAMDKLPTTYIQRPTYRFI